MRNWMQNSRMMLLLIAVVLGAGAGALAGEMEPPGPPAPTMVTLQQIYDRIDSAAGVAGVQQTGQTECWDGTGSLVPCVGTGQDGEYQKGQSATPRFTDNGDNTVTDNLTKLVWLLNPSCLGSTSWANALVAVNGLADPACGLGDGSVPGDWRLPNARELASLVDYGQYAPALPAGHPFVGMTMPYQYWTSTTWTLDQQFALMTVLETGETIAEFKPASRQVWAVRDGQ